MLAANKRLNTAYLLKESCGWPTGWPRARAIGQLWDYEREGWARRFFENWRASLKWQRLEPYEKFAEMIDRHWDGIAAYCKPENKVSLGFVEGLTLHRFAIAPATRNIPATQRFSPNHDRHQWRLTLHWLSGRLRVGKKKGV